MASEYHQSPSNSAMLNVAAMGPSSTYGGGSHSGSEFDFGTPHSLTLDTMMQSAAEMNEVAFRTGTSYPTSHAFDSNLVTHSISGGGVSVRPTHRESMSSMRDEQSPQGRARHRSSFGSFGAGRDRRESLGASDSTSLNGNPGGSNGNDNGTDGNEGNGNTNDASGACLPAWSELKTKAGKERKRLPLACIACRRKKIRCSGEKPACKHCLRSRIPCVYKVTTRKAAPRTDYMAMLDKRLKRMEERVIKIIPKEDQSIVVRTGRAVVKPSLPPPPPPKNNGASKKRGAETAFGGELDEWATARPSATAGTKEQTGPDGASKPSDAAEQNLLREGADRLPSKEIQEHLSEVFFDYVYGQSYPLLHKPSFMRKLSRGTVPPVLMLAVCAMAARFSNHPGVRSEPRFLRGEDWASAARDIALRRYDTPNITILIVYLILGLHEFGTCQGGRSWMFGGMAQRMAYALQLHKDLDHDPRNRNDEGDEKTELTFTDREIRRRTMWSCFLMDRFNSSGTDRPMFVSEQCIRAQLPIKESFYQREVNGPTEDLDGNVPNPVDPDTGQMANARANMGVVAYIVRLVSIWGKLINYLNLGGKDRDKHPMWEEGSAFRGIQISIERWKESLPDSLHYTPANVSYHASEKIANQFLFMHIVYNHIILFMNRFALPSPGSRPVFPKEMPAAFITDASHAAHEAANQVSTLIHEAMDYHVVAPFAGYAAFFSSTVHVYGAFSKNPALEASSKRNLAYNVKYLAKMKEYWGMFHFVTENLKDLYRRHAEAARSGKGSSGKEGDQAIFQYGDWFDRYPHGVSGTDYEEPNAEVKKEPGADAVLGQKSELQTVEEFFSKLSPPSRAPKTEQVQPPPQQRKAPKKRTKSEAKPPAQSQTQVQPLQQPVHHQQPQQQQQPPRILAQQPLQQASLPQTQLLQDDLLAAEPWNFPQHSTAFPPGFQQPPNPLLMTPPHGGQLLSQLDRQMVLNSYAGISPPSSSSHPIHLQQQRHTSAAQPAIPLDPTTSTLDPAGDLGLDFTSPNFNQWTGDPGASAAWFMPFNMDPPSIGFGGADEQHLFGGSGGLDWTGFTGMGGDWGTEIPAEAHVGTQSDGLGTEGDKDEMEESVAARSDVVGDAAF